MRQFQIQSSYVLGSRRHACLIQHRLIPGSLSLDIIEAMP